jgi:peptide/nickel transport system substrate-binding protein
MRADTNRRSRLGRTWGGRIVAAAVAAGMLSSWAGLAADAQTSSDAAAPVRLRVGTTVDLDTDNPFAVSAGNDWAVSTAEYDLMLKFASDDLTAAPSLATGCEPNANRTVWTCTLRDGLKWSDGKPLTSKDVAFSYRFVIDNGIPQYKSYFKFDPVFETPNDTTLIWKSKEPTFAPDMPPWVYIVPEHVWSQYDGMDLKEIRSVPNTPPVVSGPFMLTSWTHGQAWSLDRNPNYWGTPPAIDGIDYRLYSNQEAMIQALKNGEIDIADGVDPPLVNSLEGTDTVTVQKVVSDWWLNLAFNFGGQGPDANPLPALHDHDVRLAIAMAIDKQAIADKVYQGTAAPGDTFIRPASAYWHLDIPADEEIPFDPDGANALLDKGGYVDTDGDGIREDPANGEPLHLLMPASSDTTGAVESGELIVGYLKAIGISVDLKPATDAKMNDYWGSGDFDAYIWYWSGDPDPNYQLFVFTSEQCGSWSDGCWKDPHFDALYEKQGSIMDPAKRLKVIQEAQRYEYEQIPGIVLSYPGWLEAYRNDRFTGWIGAPGANGYLLPGYNYDSLVAVHPVEGATLGSSASSSVPGWIWIVVAAVIAAGVVLLMRRGRRDRLDEA